ncbi:MAG: hypothetical protein ABSH38_00215 [Verrucomicrobiota bacterium]
MTREIRAVRDRMARRVEQEGIFAFYASLEGRAAKLMAQHRSPQRAARPRSIQARKAMRRALVDALPEPGAIQEIRRIREEMLAEEKRVGSDKYWAEANRQGKEFARRHGLKYVESPSSADVLHDKPAKHKVH